jgi:hypothetical protein
MNILPQKIAGWLILLSGLVIMFLSIYYSCLFFTAKTDFPQVFKQNLVAEQPAVPNQTESPSLPGTESKEDIDPAKMNVDMQALTQQATNQAIANMIPPDTITKLLNIVSWSFFSFFLVMAGSYVSGVGIKLLIAKQPAA